MVFPANIAEGANHSTDCGAAQTIDLNGSVVVLCCCSTLDRLRFPLPVSSSPKPVGSGDVQDLAIAVEQLTEEARTLSQSIHELRDDIVWAARQILAACEFTGTSPPRPIDPLAPDADLQSSRSSRLSIDETESAKYCCDRPRLSRSGDPDAPGIACKNCGYVVGGFGSDVISREEIDAEPGVTEAPHPNAEPSQRQGTLFE